MFRGQGPRFFRVVFLLFSLSAALARVYSLGTSTAPSIEGETTTTRRALTGTTANYNLLFPPRWRLQTVCKWYVSYVEPSSAVEYCICHTLLSVIILLLPLGLLFPLRSKVSSLLWRPVGRPYYYCVVLCCVLYDGGGLRAFPSSLYVNYISVADLVRLNYTL